MYDGTIYLAGEPQSLGVDAVWGTMTDLDKSWLETKLRRYELLPEGGVGAFKVVAGAIVELRQSRADGKETGVVRREAGRER